MMKGIISNAEKKAAQIISLAEAWAEDIISNAESKRSKLEEEISRAEENHSKPMKQIQDLKLELERLRPGRDLEVIQYMRFKNYLDEFIQDMLSRLSSSGEDSRK